MEEAPENDKESSHSAHVEWMNTHQILLWVTFLFFQNLKVLLKKFHVQLAEDIHKKTVELLQDCHEWSLQDVVTTVESAL